jgi:ABC-type amino acid transport substrate-binding protein
MIPKIAFSVLLLTLLARPVGSEPFDLTILTEQYPPFNYMEDGALKGLSYDLLALMLADLDQTELLSRIELVPWSRGYQLVQYQPNTLLFSMVRTEKRENLVAWVGPILTNYAACIGKTELSGEFAARPRAESLRGKTVGVIRKDVVDQLVHADADFSQARIEVIDYPSQAVELLEHDRLDLWCYTKEAVQFYFNQKGVALSNYTTLVDLGPSGELYYGIHRDTDPAIIDALQAALDRLKQPSAGQSSSPFEGLITRYSARLGIALDN